MKIESVFCGIDLVNKSLSICNFEALFFDSGNHGSRVTPGVFVGKANSEVVLNVKVLKEGKNASFAKTLLGKGVNKNVMLYSGENTKIALEDALKNTIAELMNDPTFIEALVQNK